jgi:hypothetical protein
MILLFAAMFWITIAGANVPSALIASVLIDYGHPWLKGLFGAVGAPWWLTGLVVDGMYLGTAWVVSVMLPPMAIFFPLFTLLEDFGYLPRVAFNLDRLFKASGAHGKQAMTTMMGFGCNAAGVVATRIIDSPRERLLAILTNNFALCNGRWPAQILIATVFLGALVPASLAGLVSAAAVTGVALLGVLLTFVVGWALSRTVLKGEVSTFSLELPPYRPPRLVQTLYTSLIDRTLFVLWRAVVFALPAGAVIWLVANVHVGGDSLAGHIHPCCRSAGRFHWAVRGDSAGLHHRDPAQRDCHSDGADVDGDGDRGIGHGRGGGRDVRTRVTRGSTTAPDGRRLDDVDGRKPDALQPAAQSVQHHALHHLQGNGQRQMDGCIRISPTHARLRSLRPDRLDRAPFELLIRDSHVTVPNYEL